MASQNQHYRAAEVKGQAEEKTGHGSYVAEEKVSQMGQSTKENSGGFIQRTGEHVKNMAEGAADKVKQTFGMAGSGEEEEDDEEVVVLGGNTAAATTTTRTTRRNKY